MELSQVSKSEAARYMGVRGEPDERITAILDNCEPIVRKRLRPAYVYREVEVTFADDGVHLSGVNVPLTGKDIRSHLSGCKKAIIFAATVSAEADKLIRQAAVTDMTESLAYDCLCSAAIEQVCNRAEEEIFAGSKVYRTWRFSPGYGDLPISLQKELLYALNAKRRIGLTVTANSLLIPSKSVTAIIGVSDEPITQHKKGGCADCNMRGRCAFSKEGSNRCQM